MDRSKPISGARGPKAKITQQPPDMFIALGAKPSSSSRDDSKRPVPLSKPSTSHMPSTSGEKLKREASSSSLSSVPAKKMKVTLPGARTTSVPTLHPNERTQIGVEPWETLALDCESSDLFESIMSCLNVGNGDKAVGYILGAIKTIKNQRFKLCKITYSSLLLICGCKPGTFTNEHILAAIMSVIRRDVNGGFKAPKQGNSYIHILLINLLTHAYSDIGHWPETFVRIFVEDALGDRIWIDNPYCKPFVDNIITAFNTKLPPKSLLLCENWNSVVRDTSSPLTINSIDDEEAFGEHKVIVDGWNTKIYPRYSQNQETIEHIVLEAIKEQLNRRQQPEAISKNFIRFLSIACGLVEIRVIAVSRIESWLHNHKLMKSAQELLAYLCYNCSASTQRDLEVIAQLSKLRLKSKPMVIFFNNCLREMVFSSPANLYPLLKYTIYNELSNARNSNNLVVVGALFQVCPEASADAFADICLELLLNKDDYLRSLRALLKEINRVLRHDFNLHNVVHSLLKERRDYVAQIKDCEFKDRIFHSLGDLTAMCMLLCVNPTVRDAVTQAKRDTNVLKAFQAQVSKVQKEAVSWLQDSAVRLFKPSASDYHHVLLKVLFLEQAEHYYKVDSWPGENERNLFLRLASEVPLLEGTLLRILLIGISKENVVHPTEALDIAEQLIKRAANLPSDLDPPLSVNKLEIFDIFFNLCSYNYPENIVLPPGYVPPSLAISVLYWKVWLILLILAAHNPTTIGNVAWTKYATLRMFMEMCITNYFSFPPPTMVLSEEDFQNREQQILILEKQKILEFETHLAAASTKVEITEQNSLLLPQLMELRPEGEVRRPSAQVLEQLQNLNNTHRLGHLLCRSRNPDFLLDIMSRQGGTAHMPWLAELVHSSEGAMAHLPVQCLCEYLLSTAPAEKLTKQGQLLAHLRTVVNSNDPQMACEVLEYLFRRLTSDHGASRTQATKGLILILSPTEDSEVNTNNTTWLTQYIYQFPHFLIIKPILVQFLRQALQCETNPARVSSYINFLSTQDCIEPFSELSDLVADLSSVIIERHSVASYVLSGDNNPTIKNLISIFYLHIQKSLECREETFNILQNFTTNEYVLVAWPTGEPCAMLILVIHAAIVLLTYGPIEDFEQFDLLLNMWFPTDFEHPKAFHPETMEDTSYLPDWIKLRMIRSNVSHLVDAAIEKLEPQKLILFIQSFGIPTNSMSKLLCTLDKTTLQNPKLVVDSVLDKAYMIQLVEVQNKRGAVGGDTFVKAIELAMPPVQDTDVDLELETKKQLPAILRKTSVQINASEVVSLCVNLFDPRFSGDRNRIVSQVIKGISQSEASSSICFNYIKSLSPQFILPVAIEVNAVSVFLKVLLKNNSNQPGTVDFASTLLHSIPDKDTPIAVVLAEFLKMSSDVKMKEEKQPETTSLRLSIEKFFSEDRKDGTSDNNEELTKWFSKLETENSSLDDKKLQMDILFSRRNISFRPFFMSLVLQRASWQNLHKIMQHVFEDVSKICPISALDYLTALSQSPKLWQGRDKSFSKADQLDDVLRLDYSQVSSIVQFILEEARTGKDGDWKNQMEFRLQLLLKCVGQHAPKIVKSLIESDNEYSQELMLLIYMSLPASGQGLVNMKSHISKEAYSRNCPSAVDRLSHTLLSALTSTPRVKDWNRKSMDLNVCARKLASTHPILILRQLPMLAELKKELFRLEDGSPIDNFRYMSKMGRAFTELGLASEELQNLLKSNETFDLILIEHFLNEAQFALGHHFKAPVVLLSPMPSSVLNNHLFANPAPSSYVHNLFAPFTQYMTLTERLKNFYYDIAMTLYQYYDELPAQKRIMEKFFPNAPPFEEILYNSSLLLMNSHPSFSDPVPHMSNIIEIGGYHVLPPKELPHDLHKYLNESKHGVIYFSMGSILKSHVLTAEKRECFIQAFSKLKQDVLWKFDVDIEGLPSNVKIIKWAPQNEILAHPNVKVFVTHGGLLSTIETIYHGKPTIGIPVFSDQKFNIAASEKFGYAIKVPFDGITEEKLSLALNEILYNPKYRENAKRRSAIMHDQQVKPIDKAIYWIEYVIRHKGAPHLHSAALDLKWYQRSMLDVLAIIAMAIFSVISILAYVIRLICCKTPSRNAKQKRQ